MNTKLKSVQDWLELAQEVNWSSRELANVCQVSVRTLERFFLKNYGKTPKTWLVEQRQKRAAALLEDGMTVKETAAVLGYRYSNQFSREFGAFWGYTPTQKPVREYTV